MHSNNNDKIISSLVAGAVLAIGSAILLKSNKGRDIIDEGMKHLEHGKHRADEKSGQLQSAYYETVGKHKLKNREVGSIDISFSDGSRRSIDPNQLDKIELLQLVGKSRDTF